MSRSFSAMKLLPSDAACRFSTERETPPPLLHSAATLTAALSRRRRCSGCCFI